MEQIEFTDERDNRIKVIAESDGHFDGDGCEGYMLDHHYLTESEARFQYGDR